jgi:transposase
LGVDVIQGCRLREAGIMGKPISEDLRLRAVAAYLDGASSRAVAARFGVGESSVQRWERLFRATGSVLPKPMGGSSSPLDEHRDWLLARLAEKPDITLQELRRDLGDRGVSVGYGSVWRFIDREKLSFKKKRTGRRTRPA